MSQNKVKDWYNNIYLPQGNHQIDGTGICPSKSDFEERVLNWTSAQDYYDDRIHGTWDPDYIKKDSKCQHEFTLYQGFTDSFEYCKKCEKKKDETDG